MALSTGRLMGAGSGAILLCLLGSIVGIFIYDHSATPCECSADNAAADNDRCKSISFKMKALLIAVHLIPFVLIPVSMRVCQKGGAELQKMGMKDPERVVLGLAYIMVAIAGEIGWHVHQRWFYQEEYDVLNFFFYAFHTLGASFWALGAQTDATASPICDKLLWLCPPFTVLTYAIAASSPHHALKKIPIYCVMCYEYLLLSWRLYKLLNNNKNVWWFPFFSVGVNLFFIFLLSQNVNDVVLNPIFHMLHDAAGTEMGIAIITYILWKATSTKADSKKSS